MSEATFGEYLRANTANNRQVGGQHYRSPIQHWDFVAANNLDYFQGQITKYVCRYKNKNGVEDLYKAKHFLDKLIELEEGTRDTRKADMPSVERGVLEKEASTSRLTGSVNDR